MIIRHKNWKIVQNSLKVRESIYAKLPGNRIKAMQNYLNNNNDLSTVDCYKLIKNFLEREEGMELDLKLAIRLYNSIKIGGFEVELIPSKDEEKETLKLLYDCEVDND